MNMAGLLAVESPCLCWQNTNVNYCKKSTIFKTILNCVYYLNNVAHNTEHKL